MRNKGDSIDDVAVSGGGLECSQWRAISVLNWSECVSTVLANLPVVVAGKSIWEVSDYHHLLWWLSGG